MSCEELLKFQNEESDLVFLESVRQKALVRLDYDFAFIGISTSIH
jgi:hypothetical protein